MLLTFEIVHLVETQRDAATSEINATQCFDGNTKCQVVGLTFTHV